MASVLKPKPGIHPGIVKSVSPTTNTLKIKLRGGSVVPCVWAAGIISGMLGIKASYFPPQKTEVLIAWPEDADFGYVIATTPAAYVDPTRPTSNMLGDDAADYTKEPAFHVNNSKRSRTFLSHKPPVDLVEGEMNIENWMGVGLTMLRNMASLQASDLARVECHLLDDMVRIISDTFRHYTAFGDYKISNDGGKLNVIWNGTKNDYEAWGAQHETDPKARMTSRTRASDILTDPDQLDDGRWRFTQCIGWLGNFVNIFVTDPVKAIGKIAEGQFRSGKARLHINDDGSVLVQSVADIVLEKVVRIPVPNRISPEDDPNGDRSDVVLGRTEFLKTWKPSDDANLFEMAFQLREYTRWLNNSYSLARFHQMNRDWQVPTEAQTPEPQINSDESDKGSVNASAKNWRLAYATIRIYRDGSVQTVDAYGNAVTMTAVGVQISSPKDILIQAGGSVNIVAGRDINMVAHSNLNLSAVTKALRLSSNTAMQFICTAGNLISEVASGFWHKIIGNTSYNNTASIHIDGTIQSLTDVKAMRLGAVMSVESRAVFSNHTFQTEPNQEYDSGGNTEENHTWKSTVAPSTSLSLPAVKDHFTFQSDYGDSKHYQTITQQLSGAKASAEPTPSEVIGAAAGAEAGAKAAVAAAAAAINKLVPGAVHPETGAVAASSELPTTIAGVSAKQVQEKVAAAKTAANTRVKAAASSAQQAAVAKAKALLAPNLQKAQALADAVKAKATAYVESTVGTMVGGVALADVEKLLAIARDPTGNGGVPKVGVLASYTKDLTTLTGIQDAATAATSALQANLSGIALEMPGIPAISVPTIPGVSLPSLPAGVTIPNLQDTLKGALASTSGVANAAIETAKKKYSNVIKL